MVRRYTHIRKPSELGEAVYILLLTKEVLPWGGGIIYSITNVVCFTFICSTCATVHVERSEDNIPESVFSSYHVEPENQTQHFRDWTQVLNTFPQWGISQAQILSIYLPDWRDTQQLRIPAALPKDLGSILSTHTLAYNHL